MKWELARLDQYMSTTIADAARPVHVDHGSDRKGNGSGRELSIPCHFSKSLRFITFLFCYSLAIVLRFLRQSLRFCT